MKSMTSRSRLVTEPRGPAQLAYVAQFYIYYIYYLYIIKGFFVLPYMGRVITLQIVGSYKPNDLDVEPGVKPV